MLRTLLASLLLLAPLTGVSHAAACAQGTVSDFDGDGREDVAVGDPFAGPGAVHVLSAGKVVDVPSPALADGDGYGWSVKLAKVNADDCADLVVGAPYADVDGNQDAGAAYVVYGGAAEAPKRLVAADPQRDAHFGWSLAARGNLIAIGAPYEDEGGSADAGAVYAGPADKLRRFSQEQTDVPGNGEVGDQFGWALTFGPRNSLVIGVPYENDDGAGRQVGTGKIDSGSMTVLNDVTATTITATKWEPTKRTTGDRFGYAVAYSDKAGLAVSSPQGGFVQLFDANIKAKATIPVELGLSLAASAEGQIAIGTPLAGPDRTGAVQVVSAQNPGDARVIAPQPQPDGRYGWSVAFSDNRVVAGMPDARPYGSVSITGRNADQPELLWPAKGADFGVSVAG